MEQKNRMVQSGVSQLVSVIHSSKRFDGGWSKLGLTAGQIYLVEEHDSKKAMETWGRQIWTMKSSLQIVE